MPKKKPTISLPGNGPLARTVREINKRKIANSNAGKDSGTGEVSKPVAVGNTTTAKNPSTIKRKTKKQGDAQLKKLRAKQAKRKTKRK